jgi:hypothetical protein
LWNTLELLHDSQPKFVADALASEAACLMSVGRRFDGFVEHGKRVSPTCLVHSDRGHYSVPPGYGVFGVAEDSTSTPIFAYPHAPQGIYQQQLGTLPAPSVSRALAKSIAYVVVPRDLAAHSSTDNQISLLVACRW